MTLKQWPSDSSSVISIASIVTPAANKRVRNCKSMLVATDIAHGQRLELDAHEVNQSAATGSLEVGAAAAQQA